MNRMTRAVLTALAACAVVIGTVLVAGAGGGSTATASSASLNALTSAASQSADPAPGTTPAQRWHERRAARRAVVFELLPDALQADITAVRAAPKDQRPAMRAEIMRKALAGDYGDKVKAAAEKLQELRGR